MDELTSEAIALSEDAVIRSILEEVCRVTTMGFVALARVTETRWIACQVIDRIEFGLKPGDELQLKTTICDEIRESGDAVIIDQVGAEDQWRTHPTPILYGFESYASIPIFLDDGSFFGTLCAIDPEPRRLNAPTMVATLRAHAARIARVLTLRG